MAGASRTFASFLVATAFQTVCRNALAVPDEERGCIWTRKYIPPKTTPQSTMNMPPAEQLAEFYGEDAIKLCHTGEIVPNPQLRSKNRLDHEKTNEEYRRREARTEWADRDWEKNRQSGWDDH
eukprot:5027293-Amphidinium_carterae.1